MADRSVPAAYLLGSRSRVDEPRSSAAATRSVGATFRLPASRSAIRSASGEIGQSVLAAGGRYLGTRYEMGGGRGVGQVRSTDCSAFVARAFADATGGRIKLTAYTDAMHEQTTPVAAADARPGDLVFYRGSDPSQPGCEYPHVAIYAGAGRVLDASSSVGHVSYRPLGLGPNYTPEFRRVKGA